MPGGGGPKGLFQLPSGTQRPAWGASLAGGTNAGKASAIDATNASAAWQSVLSSLGIGASKSDVQEPSIDENPDSDPGTLQESATGKDGATPFIPGTAGLVREVEVTPASWQAKSQQASAGNIEVQHQSGIGPEISAGRTPLPRTAPAEASGGIGSSKYLGVSDSESADSARKPKNSPALEDVALGVPQMVPIQLTLISSQPDQQSSAAAAPPMKTMWQEKSPFATTQPNQTPESPLRGIQGQTDPATPVAPMAAARTRSDPGPENEDFKAGEVSAGGQIGGHQVITAEPQRYPVAPQIGATVESHSMPVPGTSTPASAAPLDIPIETGTVSNSVQLDAAQAAQETGIATQVGNRSPEPESNAVEKSRKLNVSSLGPVQGASIQSVGPISTPAVSSYENRASEVVPPAVTAGHLHGTAAKNDGRNQIPLAHSSPVSVGMDAVPPAATGGSAVAPVAVSSIGAPGSAVGHGGSGAGEAFSTLDTEGSNRVTWVRAGAQQAEAGFEDPQLGWVSVRADVNGGTIHASLVPATADAAQVMGGHLDGLNAYLSEHHSTVETITLSAPAGRAHEEPGSQGQGMQRGAGQEPGQGSSQQSGEETGNGYSSNRESSLDFDGRGVSSTSSVVQAVLQDTPVPSSNSGSRISLMA